MRYLVFVLFLLIPILGVYTFVAADQWNLWFPDAYSTYAGEIDSLFNVIAIAILITFVGTEIVLAFAVLRYANVKLEGKSAFTHGSHKLEMVWTAIPALLLLIIAFWQMGTWSKIKYDSAFPQGESPYSIANPIATVTASQFDWRVRYPDASGDMNGIDAFERPFEFVVPVDVPVVFNLKSRDVLHSFFVPVFRLKQDAVPGMTIPVWFEATKTGSYDLICAELCGWGHYKMAGKIRVVTQDEYDQFLSDERAAFYSNGAGE